MNKAQIAKEMGAYMASLEPSVRAEADKIGRDLDHTGKMPEGTTIAGREAFERMRQFRERIEAA